MHKFALTALCLSLFLLPWGPSLPTGQAADEPSYKGKTLQEWTRALQNADVEGRRQAAEALYAIGVKAGSAVPQLIKALKDADEGVRWRSAEALGQIGADAKEAVPALSSSLQDKSGTVRASAAGALAALGSEAKAAVPALSAALRDVEYEVRRKSADALGRLGKDAKEAVPALSAALKDKDDGVRRRAAEALGRIGKDARDAVQALLPLLKDEEDEVQRAAAEALKLIDPEAAAKAGIKQRLRCAGDQPMSNEEMIQRAAQAVAKADALLIGAGAGMGVDSGLPDFRGNQGFWQAYPPYAKRGLSFSSLANPQWFVSDPAFAWGFYGHRLNLYRATRPHDGFAILQTWAQRMPQGAFVYTSNVDGQFQRAGFDPERILEVHGAIDWMQCTRKCGIGLFAADSFQVEVDETTMHAREPLPACPSCGALARPNILMFGDADWDYRRAYPQEARLNAWFETLAQTRIVIIECGAGTAIPSVRHLCESVANTPNATLIRINPREPAVPSGQIGLALGALEGLRAIQERMKETRETGS